MVKCQIKGKSHKESPSRRRISAVIVKGVPELLRGVGFTIARGRLDLYLNTLKRLGVYVCATYKNGSDLEMCLDSKELLLPEETILPDYPTPHQQKMWDL